ncbi:MAG: preprotein translocase subunit SecY [Eubacteriales bacterium]|nr:preprotein translocase subunit SecY [Eubacteriales bacterium]
MLATFVNACKVKELRRKMLFTLLVLVLYRLGAVIPVPFVNSELLNAYMTSYAQGSLFQYFSILSGGAFSKATLFALSVSPYITASIVIQLLSIAIPALERIAKDGDAGRKKLNRYTRYLTVVLALITSYGYYLILKQLGSQMGTDVINYFTGSHVFEAIVIIACYCAGAALIMWMGEKIDEYGIGNGISLILFVNIISRIPTLCGEIYGWGNVWWSKLLFGVGAVVVCVVVVGFIVHITESERRLPVQYAKKVVGRKMYGGQSTTLPIKLNMNGVMPIIFASSIVSLPATIASVFTPKSGSFWEGLVNFFSTDSWFYPLCYFIFIILFAYFYTEISFNPVEVANNLKQNGGFILGIRPGRPTADYIKKVLNKVTLMGALFLSLIAVLPIIINIICGGKIASIAFSGSSVLIMVGVALETARELEAQLTLRHYKGFLE